MVEIPPHLTSRMPLRVRFCETDLMGIVHHANYITYFEAGRVDWLIRRGVSYDAWVAMGVHLPVVEVKARYRKPARFNEELVIETSATDLTRVTVTFVYRIFRKDELICEGETLLACVGNDLRPKRFPPEVVAALESAETHPVL